MERFRLPAGARLAGSPICQAGFDAEARIFDTDGSVLPLRLLPAIIRTLLVTDGTVTKLLEAHFWEPVNVVTLAQGFEPAGVAVPAIEVRHGERCLTRTARLRGGESGRVFADADSLIRVEHLPEPLRQRLIERRFGIGVLIRDSGLESYREVLECGLERAEDGAPVVWRSYRVFIAGRPSMLITERFPLAVYAGAAPGAEV